MFSVGVCNDRWPNFFESFSIKLSGHIIKLVDYCIKMKLSRICGHIYTLVIFFFVKEIACNFSQLRR